MKAFHILQLVMAFENVISYIFLWLFAENIAPMALAVPFFPLQETNLFTGGIADSIKYRCYVNKYIPPSFVGRILSKNEPICTCIVRKDGYCLTLPGRCSEKFFEGPTEIEYYVGTQRYLGKVRRTCHRLTSPQGSTALGIGVNLLAIRHYPEPLLPSSIASNIIRQGTNLTYGALVVRDCNQINNPIKMVPVFIIPGTEAASNIAIEGFLLDIATDNCFLCPMNVGAPLIDFDCNVYGLFYKPIVQDDKNILVYIFSV